MKIDGVDRMKVFQPSVFNFPVQPVNYSEFDKLID